MQANNSEQTDTSKDSSTNDLTISPIRTAIYWRAEKHKNSLWKTFERNYLAAKMVGIFGWMLQLFTAGVGAALIYVVTQSPDGQVYGLDVTDLAILLLVVTLVMVFYEPKLRSKKYYDAGQKQQELCDLFIDFIEIEVPNKSKDLDELETKLVKLNARRHRLNQSTPQLGGFWYYIMRTGSKISELLPWIDSSSWSQKPLEERMFPNNVNNDSSTN